MNPSTAHAQVIVDELVRCGVTDAVLCPGSRSAPLAFALHAADAAGRLRLHVRIDERTAGFLALGLALRSGRPVPVVTTSGTAVANLHPAVLEASHAGVPLLVLTADRPPQLIGTGANQTVVQPGIFGDAVRLALVGRTRERPRAGERAVARGRRAGGGRCARHAPGPVHVNLPFVEPLVPDGERLRRVGPAACRGPRWPGPGCRPHRCRSTRRRRRWWSPARVRRPRSATGGCRSSPSRRRGCGTPGCEPARGCSARSRTVCARPRSWSPAARPCTARCSGCSPTHRWPSTSSPTRRAAAGRTSPGPSTPSGPRRHGARRRVGRRAGSTPTAQRPRRSTPPSTPRKRPAACGWPGRWSTPCPVPRCSSSARRTRSATCRSGPFPGGTWRCSRTAVSPASTARCPRRSVPGWPMGGRLSRCSAT